MVTILTIKSDISVKELVLRIDCANIFYLLYYIVKK